MEVVIVDTAARGQCVPLLNLTESSGTQTSAAVHSGMNMFYYLIL